MQQRNNLGIASVLLTVGFAWACEQQVPTAPPAPPAVDSVSSATSIPPSSARGATGSDKYKYWGEGDLTLVTNPQDAQPVAGSGDTVHLCGAACGDSVKGQLPLSESIRSHWLPEHANNCFGVDPLPVTVFVSRVKKSPGSVLGRVWFSGMGTGGEKTFSYELRLTGETADTFPPGPGETATVVWGDSGEMTAQGKGKGSKGGCTGDVSVNGSFTLEGCPGVDSCLTGT